MVNPCGYDPEDAGSAAAPDEMDEPGLFRFEDENSMDPP